MVDPVSISLALGGTVGTGISIASGLSAISTGLGIFSAISTLGSVFSGGQAQRAESQAQVNQLQAQSDASAYNANVAAQNAEIAKGNTAAEVAKADRERRLRAGANVAAAGAGGALGNANFLDLAMDNAGQEELNILNIKQQGLLKQRSYAQTANLDSMASRNVAGQIPLAQKAYKYNSAASTLGGISKLASFAR